MIPLRGQWLPCVEMRAFNINGQRKRIIFFLLLLKITTYSKYLLLFFKEKSLKSGFITSDQFYISSALHLDKKTEKRVNPVQIYTNIHVSRYDQLKKNQQHMSRTNTMSETKFSDTTGMF